MTVITTLIQVPTISGAPHVAAPDCVLMLLITLHMLLTDLTRAAAPDGVLILLITLHMHAAD